MTSNRPKWQRARVVKDENPAFIGREVWVLNEPPVNRETFSIEHPHRRGWQLQYTLNFIHADAPVYAPSVCLELLARGPEDFADDVELISWEQWLMTSAPEKPA